ncbi:MAG: hypothetical protein R2932_50510 [Caldilineaceae bacterium]
MFIFTSANNNIFTNLFLTVLLGVLSTVTAFIFAEGLLSVTLILSRSLLIVRLLGLTVAGSILGYLLYLFLVDGQIGWMAGGVTGATLSVRHWLDSQKPNIKQVSVGFIAIFVALISVLQLYYFGDSQTATTLIAAAIISFLFTLVFLRYAFLSQS